MGLLLGFIAIKSVAGIISDDQFRPFSSAIPTAVAEDINPKCVQESQNYVAALLDQQRTSSWAHLSIHYINFLLYIQLLKYLHVEQCLHPPEDCRIFGILSRVTAQGKRILIWDFLTNASGSITVDIVQFSLMFGLRTLRLPSELRMSRDQKVLTTRCAITTE